MTSTALGEKGAKMSDRLISADKLKAKQQEDADLFIGDDTLSGKSRRDEALNAVANIVNAPTVDAVPVVRCKDCKWYKESKHSELNSLRFCYRLRNDSGIPVGYNWDDNDFCSYGERREDEAD